jgi:hypothetical protein
MISRGCGKNLILSARYESNNLLPALADIKAQLRVGDPLLVVADNCTDNTASVAGRQTPMSSFEMTRFGREGKGRGHALDFGIRHTSPRTRLTYPHEGPTIASCRNCTYKCGSFSAGFRPSGSAAFHARNAVDRNVGDLAVAILYERPSSFLAKVWLGRALTFIAHLAASSSGENCPRKKFGR